MKTKMFQVLQVLIVMLSMLLWSGLYVNAAEEALAPELKPLEGAVKTATETGKLIVIRFKSDCRFSKKFAEFSKQHPELKKEMNREAVYVEVEYDEKLRDHFGVATGITFVMTDENLVPVYRFTGFRPEVARYIREIKQGYSFEFTVPEAEEKFAQTKSLNHAIRLASFYENSNSKDKAIYYYNAVSIGSDLKVIRLKLDSLSWDVYEKGKSSEYLAKYKETSKQLKLVLEGSEANLLSDFDVLSAIGTVQYLSEKLDVATPDFFLRYRLNKAKEMIASGNYERNSEYLKGIITKDESLLATEKK